MKKIFWKKIFCRTTCILVVLAFVFPLLIQSAFASTEGGETGGTVIINPSYDTTNGRLSVKGKIIDGGSIRVTIKLSVLPISYYTLMKTSDADGEYVFTGPVTYEEGKYKIYVGTNNRTDSYDFLKIEKETPVERSRNLSGTGTRSTPDTSTGIDEGTRKSISDFINRMETLKNIDGTIDSTIISKL